MARRKRKKIKPIELLASALADKLPQAERDALRAAKVPALQVVRMFTPDHIHLHTWGGSDLWWNLDMRRRGLELKAKDNADTSRAAKAVRIEEKWRAFTRGLKRAKPTKPPGARRLRGRSTWPKGRKIRNAGERR